MLIHWYLPYPRTSCLYPERPVSCPPTLQVLEPFVLLPGQCLDPDLLESASSIQVVALPLVIEAYHLPSTYHAQSPDLCCRRES